MGLKPFERGVHDITPELLQKMKVDLKSTGFSPDALNKAIKNELQAEVWLSDKYQVSVRRGIKEADFPEVIWLSIKRIDREPIHDWRDLQEIKNMLVGPEHEGFELYPAESRKVDTANQYHMFVFADPMLRFPVGFDERLVTDKPFAAAKQRPFDK